MWPLYLVFIFATAAPQQNSTNVVRSPQQTLPLQARSFDDESQRNTCYTMRSYLFRHHDGLAPVPAGMTTCTPANILQQRRVTTGPNGLFMPLGLKADEQK
jgi:hypothetical protein